MINQQPRRFIVKVIRFNHLYFVISQLLRFYIIWIRSNWIIELVYKLITKFTLQRFKIHLTQYINITFTREKSMSESKKREKLNVSAFGTDQNIELHEKQKQKKQLLYSITCFLLHPQLRPYKLQLPNLINQFVFEASKTCKSWWALINAAIKKSIAVYPWGRKEYGRYWRRGFMASIQFIE